MSEKQRELWIDVAKGFSILFVVMGHSGDVTANHYLSWFRMPLFFLLSGLVFKPVDPVRFGGWAIRRTKGLMTPYFAYGLLIAVILAGATLDVRGLAESVARLLYGGLALTGPFGVFWFITCLLVTQLVFGYLTRFALRTQLIVVAACYIVAQVIAMSPLQSVNMPWNADVALLAMAYYAMGYYGKRWIPLIIRRLDVLPLLILISAAVFYADYSGVYSYTLNMKYKDYSGLLPDLAIPAVLSLTVCALVYWAVKILPLRLMADLGRNTIAIMYLHLPVNYGLKAVLGTDYGIFWFTLAGVLLPLFAAAGLRRSPLLAKLYLGHSSGGPKPALYRDQASGAASAGK
ncbi:acyltransferase family protein [Paenibacillus sp. CN-4]|uniref:acyltransferase family protein n=1 Tax=Paenibacillus nanchangensis TaxID=3348343 RepID=UPI00397C6ED9